MNLSKRSLVPACAFCLTLAGQKMDVPRTWDETALKDWATPIAALGVRPGLRISAEDRQALLAFLRTV